MKIFTLRSWMLLLLFLFPAFYTFAEIRIRPTANSGSWALLTALQPTTATLNVTSSSLPAFTTTVGTASAQQGNYVSGTDLTGAVTATAPAGFEVSWTSGSNFGPSQVLTQSGGTFANVPLYIRLTGATLGSFSGNVTLTSPGATTQIAVSGTVSTVVNSNPVAVVTRISPNSGSAGIPVLMHFYGTNFVPGVTGRITAQNNSLYFNVGPTTFIDATHFTALVTSSAASVTMRGYAGASNPTPGGGDGTPAGTILYTATPAPPIITSFSPTSGPVGTSVLIKGYNLFVTSNGGGIDGSIISFNGTTTGTFPGSTEINVTVPVGATTGFITITNINGGAVSAIPFVVTTPRAFFEDFEAGTKTGYAAASVQLQSGGWTLGESLIGTTAGADKFNGVKSARLRGGGFIEMDVDKPNGAGVVTVSAATYSTETGASFVPEISVDGGVTYASLLGNSPAPTLTNTLTQYSFVANRPGNVRLRFSSTNTTAATNPRLNLDDIDITDYRIGTAVRTGQALPELTVFPNPAHEQFTVRGVGTGPVQASLFDLTGRRLLAPTTLPATQILRLPTALPAGIYLLQITTSAGSRTVRLLTQ
jgi:hypothetical protein